MAKDAAQKTEKPTPRRLREARQKGQIPRSVDLVQWVTLLAASFVIPHTFAGMLSSIDERLALAMHMAAGGRPGPAFAATISMVGAATLALGSLFAFVVVSSIVGMAAQGGVVLSAHPLKPKWERVSPKAGFKRLFSVQSVMETAKAVTRLAVLAVLVSTTLMAAAETHLFSAGLDLRTSTDVLIDQMLLVLRLAAFGGSAVGLADYGFQRWQAMKRLKMSKQEVKEDQRSSDGDPAIRNRRRSAHAKLSRNQMLRAVADATVIVVNPTHYAVALTYSDDGKAPTMSAKGTDELSWRIRERAALADVPIVESPPLARALHASVEVGDAIPEAFFEAVAIVLAFVLQARAKPSDTSAQPRAHAGVGAGVGTRDRAAGSLGAQVTAQVTVPSNKIPI